MLRGEQVVLRPVQADDGDPLRRIRDTPEVARWWGEEPTRDPAWPLDTEPGEVRYAVLVDGVVAGLIQSYEEDDPEFRHAGMDLFLDASVSGRGVGRDAVRTLARHLLQDCGHHRLVIDPAAANEAAIRCYTAVGFRPVGVMREYWWDPTESRWVDGLLMDLLARELR